jgi:hypothetical protein
VLLSLHPEKNVCYCWFSRFSRATTRSLSSTTKVASRLNIGSSPNRDWGRWEGGIRSGGGAGWLTRAGGRDSTPASLDSWVSKRLSCALSCRFSDSNREMRVSKPDDADAGVQLRCSRSRSIKANATPSNRKALNIVLIYSGWADNWEMVWDRSKSSYVTPPASWVVRLIVRCQQFRFRLL